MKHALYQFKFYRKFIGGFWVKVDTHLPMNSFWCLHKDMPKCCGSHVVNYEYWS